MGLLLMFVLCTGMLFVFYHLCIMLHVAVTCLGSCGSDFQPIYFPYLCFTLLKDQCSRYFYEAFCMEQLPNNCNL